jgi:diguanylate cyclase (GGDEF)-like protein
VLSIDKDDKILAKDDFILSTDEVSSSDKPIADAAIRERNLFLKQINLHGKQVVDKMIKENIPPTPANFAIYYEKLLEDKPLSQKQNINAILELEEVEDFDYVSKIENNINEGFTNIKSMMEVISGVYTKINKLRAITKKRKDEIAKWSNNLALVAYDEDLAVITEVLAKQQTSLKEQYTNVSAVIKKFSNESIFDSKYDVYNKKYLLKTINNEKNNVKNFGYESMLLAIKVKNKSLENVRLTRDKDLIIKTVGKMILKRSRRSDVIAHLQDGIFVLILKHTNEEQAQKTIESIENMISFSNYIVDSETIDIELDFALSRILPNKTKEQIIAVALEKLPA